MKRLPRPSVCKTLNHVGLVVAIAMAVLGVGQVKAAPAAPAAVPVLVAPSGCGTMPT